MLLLRVDLVDVDFSFVLLCQILQDGCDDLTGIAPVRVKIDDAGLVSGKTPLLILFKIKNLILEAFFG